MAVEQRLLIPRDVITGRNVFADFRITYKDSEFYSGYSEVVRAPFVLPELKFLSCVSLEDERYHSLVFEEKDVDILRQILREVGMKPIEVTKGNPNILLSGGRNDPHQTEGRLRAAL